MSLIKRIWHIVVIGACVLEKTRLISKDLNRMFHRNEGYHLSFVINAFFEREGFKMVASGKKAEKLIREKLPAKEFTQEYRLFYMQKHSMPS